MIRVQDGYKIKMVTTNIIIKDSWREKWLLDKQIKQIIFFLFKTVEKLEKKETKRKKEREEQNYIKKIREQKQKLG